MDWILGTAAMAGTARGSGIEAGDSGINSYPDAYSNAYRQDGICSPEKLDVSKAVGLKLADAKLAGSKLADAKLANSTPAEKLAHRARSVKRSPGVQDDHAATLPPIEPQAWLLQRAASDGGEGSDGSDGDDGNDRSDLSNLSHGSDDCDDSSAGSDFRIDYNADSESDSESDSDSHSRSDSDGEDERSPERLSKSLAGAGLPGAGLAGAGLTGATLTGTGLAAKGVYPPGAGGPPKLSAEEERVLMEHLPVVRFLARRIHERLPQHVEIEDLFSAGLVGLMDAFAKFDPAKKVQFRSYAQFRIRGAILDSLRTMDWSPRELRRKGRAVEEAIRALMSRLGRAPSETEIAAELGTTLESYQRLLGDLKGLEIGTLHLERNEDSGEEELAYVPGRPDEDPLFRCLRGELEGRLTAAIQELPERERLVMTLYYYEEMTMREIGLALGVVESRVSQIHASAVLHLRSALSDLSRRGETRSEPERKPVRKRDGRHPSQSPADRGGFAPGT